MKVCVEAACDIPAKAHGMCKPHYMKWYHRGGRELAKSTRPTPEQRFWAKVDKTEDHWLFTGSKGGYGQLGKEGGRIGAHVFSWELENGPVPAGFTIDHDDRCPKNCVRPSHLRLATQKQQNENRPLFKNNTSGYRGVTWNKPLGKWRASAFHCGKYVHAGYFEDIEEAAEAARLKRLELFTHNDADRRKL